ncbi:helix-turn-helix domain-containing protein [Vibrio anguillarum]|uniref:helix-turn-helix domain-containing protein n=1 Tax=Vibrio anguillarum TaxID=55601 RepID=UPI00188D9B1C|nr:S24 family peptidase [Vibrio anguillarum]MBF4250502.1 helix-turn-helix domain-containing protein [Vibrio anguillarum]
MDIGKIIRKARLDAGLTMKMVEAATGILASNQSKIELGENNAPGFFTIARLAEYYGLSLDGIYGAMKTSSSSSVIAARTRKCVQLPIISWVQAGAWREAVAIIDEDGPVIASPFKCSEDAYALEVCGDSMTASHGSLDSFQEGSIIVIEPNMEARNKSFVVARTKGSDDVTFKQLVFDGSKKFLRPLNPQYPIIPIDQPIEICGVVLGKIQKITT